MCEEREGSPPHERSAGAASPARVALAIPVLTLVFTLGLFPASAAAFGERAGYNFAFAVYWAFGLIVSAVRLGPLRLRSLLRFRPLPAPIGLALAILVVPPLGGAWVAFAPQIAGASASVIVVALGRAVINATAEELLWRGLAVAELGGLGWIGWVYPALAFVAFHAAPLLVHGGWTVAPGVFLGAVWIGFGYGWIAGRSRSIGWPLVAHIATDAMGLAAARFALG